MKDKAYLDKSYTNPNMKDLVNKVQEYIVDAIENKSSFWKKNVTNQK